MDETAKKILSGLEAKCSKREYCSSDIETGIGKAFKDKGIADYHGAASEILSSLVRDGYVDDLRYASAFAREKSALTGWGPVKIRYALAAKRIPRETIDSALGEIDCGKAEDKLLKLLETKWRSLEGDPQGKLKLIRFALSRGYDYDTVEAAVRRTVGY